MPFRIIYCYLYILNTRPVSSVICAKVPFPGDYSYDNIFHYTVLNSKKSQFVVFEAYLLLLLILQSPARLE